MRTANQMLAQLDGALRRVRWRLFRNSMAGKLTNSRLRVAMVALFSLIFWGGIFLLFLEGFQFLKLHRLLSGPLIEMLFGLFFASLLVMLVFSTGIILYAGLFSSNEAEFLLVQPIPADRVFLFKFQEAMFFSSWGFVLLGSPMMTAYGLSVDAPWYFYVLGLVFFVTFALVPASAGALACLLITAYLPRRRREVMIALGLFIVVGATYAGLRTWRQASGDVFTHAWLNSLFQQLRLSNLPFLPSQWISKGLLAGTLTEGLGASLTYLLVLLSNALFLYLVTAVGFHRIYRQAYDRVHSTSTARKRPPRRWLPAIVDKLFAPLSGPIRVLIVKDVRIFLRDPVQWSQVLIFSGLLIFYFITLGRINYYTASPYWRNLIGFFNLAVSGLILSTFTSRFIFPLLSLEGQKFWVLGLCPVSRAEILWGKFAFASGGSLLVTVTLTLLSAFMLKLDPLIVLLQLATVLILCFGLSGIAVGLGARFPDMHETDPSKIAAGFGGTLNLVTSMAFIIAVIVMMALPCHLYSITLAFEGGAAELDPLVPTSTGLSLSAFRFWLGVSIAISIGLGALATLVPMRLGLRAFREMEF